MQDNGLNLTSAEKKHYRSEFSQIKKLTKSTGKLFRQEVHIRGSFQEGKKCKRNIESSVERTSSNIRIHLCLKAEVERSLTTNSFIILLILRVYLTTTFS